MFLDTGITITTKKIEDFSTELGIIEFLRLLSQNPRIIPHEITIIGLDKLLFASEKPDQVMKLLYFLFQKIHPHICVQIIISCEIRTSGTTASFKYKSREIKVNSMFKQSYIRGYHPDLLFVRI